MKSVVRAAAAQMHVEWLDPSRNLETICRMTGEAGRAGADIVVFPELVSSGFIVDRDRTFMPEYLDAAIDIPGPFTDQVATAVRDAGCYAVVGVARRHPTIPACLFNSSVLFTPTGEIANVYDKCHIPSEEKHYFFEGSSLDVILTELGAVGQLICADNSFPEAARALAMQGVEILTVCYARPRVTPFGLYQSVIQTRAFENQCFVVSANRVGAEVRGDHNITFEGGTAIVGPGGEVLASTDSEKQELIVADLNRRELEAARLWQTRFRDRRPDLYSPLVGGS